MKYNLNQALDVANFTRRCEWLVRERRTCILRLITESRKEKKDLIKFLHLMFCYVSFEAGYLDEGFVKTMLFKKRAGNKEFTKKIPFGKTEIVWYRSMKQIPEETLRYVYQRFRKIVYETLFIYLPNENEIEMISQIENKLKENLRHDETDSRP